MRSKNGSRWLAAIRARAPEERLAQAQEKLADHGVVVLVLSRLVPAGRIPVMLACLMAKWPLRQFARGESAGVSGVGGDVPADRDPGRLAVQGAVAGRGGGGRADGGVSAAPSMWKRVRSAG